MSAEAVERRKKGYRGEKHEAKRRAPAERPYGSAEIMDIDLSPVGGERIFYHTI